MKMIQRTGFYRVEDAHKFICPIRSRPGADARCAGSLCALWREAQMNEFGLVVEWPLLHHDHPDFKDVQHGGFCGHGGRPTAERAG